MIDPVTNLISVGTPGDVQAMLTRVIDHLKTEHITVMLTSLARSDASLDAEATISSLMDTWIVLTNDADNGRHRRALYVLKSRGMPHSAEQRAFELTDEGVHVLPPARPGAAPHRSAGRDPRRNRDDAS